MLGGRGTWMLRRMHAEFRRRDSTARGFLDLEARAGIQAVESVDERVGGSPGVQQSADGHVAADPGKGI
jgi:hypothetical protein